MSIDLYLASASPRRLELLESMGLRVETCPADIDESILSGETPDEYVQRLSLEKAKASFLGLPNRVAGIPFLGSDTIVVCDGEVFGKPLGKEDAFRMWEAMSGNQHLVLTSVAIISDINDSNLQKVITSKSVVSLKVITEQEMQSYWQSSEPQDKAGAYGIQGKASAWVSSIQGSYTGIMGLPLFETNACLRKYGLNWL